MSTTKPRITITLEPKTAAQLKRLSELTGSSQSSMVSEILEQSTDVFDRLIAVLDAAEQAKASSFGVSAQRLKEAQEKIEGHLGIVMAEFGDVTAPFLDSGESPVPKVKRGAGVATRVGKLAPHAVGDAPTPISNRGVRLDPKATKDIAPKQIQVRQKVRKVSQKIRGGE